MQQRLAPHTSTPDARVSRVALQRGSCLLGLLMLMTGVPAHAGATTDAAVLAPVNAFFSAMSRYDKPAMRAQLLPGGMATLLRHGKPVQLRLDAFVDGIKPGKDKIEERISDPLVRIDDDIAMVWAPYRFLINGTIHHCGTDVFNLVRQDGHWLIAGVADNSRTACSNG